MASSFTAEQVQEVSNALQDYMHKNSIECMTADECAQYLADNGYLPNDVGPPKAPGFNFRQMLRDGRDGLIPLVTGAYQERPRKRWEICQV